MFEGSYTSFGLARAEQWLANDLSLRKHVDSSQISKISFRNYLDKIGRLIRPKRVIKVRVELAICCIRRKSWEKKLLDNNTFPKTLKLEACFLLHYSLKVKGAEPEKRSSAAPQPLASSSTSSLMLRRNEL